MTPSPEAREDNVRRGPWPSDGESAAPKRSFKDRFLEMLGREDVPERVAASFAIGVAISFTPLLGLHWVMALALAFLLKLNKLDVLLGTLVVNPLTLGPVSAVAIPLGRFVLKARSEAVTHLPMAELMTREFWSSSRPAVRAMGLQWATGMFVLTVVAGAATYVILLRALRSRQRARAEGIRLHTTRPR